MNESHASPRLGALLSVLAILGVLGALVLLIVKIWNGETEDPYAGMLLHKIERGSLEITVRSEGLLESEENHEFKSKVRGRNAILWIVESGTFVNEGDELVRLDALFIQEQVDERTKYANWSQSGADHSASRLAKAEIDLEAYQNGRFQTEKLSAEQRIAVAESTLQTAEDQLKHVQLMESSGFLSETQLERSHFAVENAKRNLAQMHTALDVLKNFTYEEQLKTLKGRLTSVAATHKANVERAMADNSRRDRAVEELDYCTIKADRSGLVIHPNAAAWERAPVAEGTLVWKDQVLLIMPDLKKMQVKIGVHESSVDRVKVGQRARVVMGDRVVEGAVSEVASITKPAGWWTGNQVRYDTLIALPYAANQLPGMSAEVEVVVANYDDVLLIPAAAVIDSNEKHFCWISGASGPERIEIELGDQGESFYVVQSGLSAGDDIYMNPFAFETLAEQMEPSEEDPNTLDKPSE